ncbi:hypothetical protein CPB83DRAFT_900742 [Crepidotus variabilis]|uniref:Uncharacterized protein n=1 Tax=Crepidotus variabilis TaxID=179855 RepID=A0A9P6E090_9AGAR|nr:hypothetical protein CPB83DRAFT_900748 [Crepidotus variabilis]KAF9521426.1 hypothetical protein CPB83DRAFT_900742 [Crepidotus variabilis]
MTKRKASDSIDNVGEPGDAATSGPSSLFSVSKKKKTLLPDELIDTTLKKIASSNGPVAKTVQQMLARAVVAGDDIMKETTGGMKPKISKKAKGKAKTINSNEVPNNVVDSVGMIIHGLAINPAFHAHLAAGLPDDGSLSIWLPFFQSQRELNAQNTAMTDQDLLKPLDSDNAITSLMTHSQLTELLQGYFPSVFDNLDRLALGEPARKHTPYVLCSKIPKGGYQPLQNPYPDGKAIAKLFSKGGSNVECKVLFGKCCRQPLSDDVNPDYVEGQLKMVHGSPEPTQLPTPPIIPTIPDPLTNDDEIKILEALCPSQLRPSSSSESRVLRPRSTIQHCWYYKSKDKDKYEVVAGLFGGTTPTSVTAVGTQSPSPMEAIESQLSQSLSFVLEDKPNPWEEIAAKEYNF